MKKKVKIMNRNLSLPDVTIIDNLKQFPRYSSILERQDGEGVGIEEIDTLQMEIETLLVNALQRARTFQVELMILESKAADKTDLIPIKLKTKVSTPVAPPTLIHTPNITPIIEKQQQQQQQQLQTPNAKRFKASNTQQRPSSTFTCNTDENSLVIRNDISDIFWNMVQPFCSEITEDDIKFLKDQIELNCKIQINSSKEIPNLGKHYTLKWAEHDVVSEIKESSRFNLDVNGGMTVTPSDKKRKNFSNFLNEIDTFQASTDSDASSERYGPLTQRLISALIEQNLMTPFGTNLNDFDMLNGEQKGLKTQQTIKNHQHRQYNSNSNLFESKIRDELIQQGILDRSDLDSGDDICKKGSEQSKIEQKDEIADEIKKLQEELLLVAGKNKDSQIELLNNAKQAMVQQNLRKKIDQCDLKIQEIFSKNLAVKLNKKYCQRKEKDRLSEIIKERDALKNQMSQVMLPNFAYPHSV
jgi:transcriptional adapter 3